MNTEIEQQVPTKRHYWLREDFDELMDIFSSGDIEFPGDRKSSSSLVYPKNTEGAFRELRLRGLDCDASSLTSLVEKRIVRPAGDLSSLEWGKEDIDAAAEWLYENDHWGHWTHFCWVANLRYGQAVQAHRYMCARHGLGFSHGFDVIGVNTVIEAAPDTEGYARIRFYPMHTRLVPATQEVAE